MNLSAAAVALANNILTSPWASNLLPKAKSCKSSHANNMITWHQSQTNPTQVPALPTQDETLAVQTRIDQERKKVMNFTHPKVDSHVLFLAQQFDFLRRIDGQFPGSMLALKQQFVKATVDSKTKMDALKAIWYGGFDQSWDAVVAVQYATLHGIAFHGNGNANRGCIVQVVNQKRNEMRGQFRDYIKKNLKQTVRVSTMKCKTVFRTEKLSHHHELFLHTGARHWM